MIRRPLDDEQRHANELLNVHLLAALDSFALACREARGRGELGAVPDRLRDVVEVARQGLAALELVRSGARGLGLHLSAESEARFARCEQVIRYAMEECPRAAQGVAVEIDAAQAGAHRAGGTRSPHRDLPRT